MPAQGRVVGLPQDVVVPVAADGELADLAADVGGPLRVGALPDQVAQAEDPRDPAALNVAQRGLERGDIAVYVGDDGDSFHVRVPSRATPAVARS